MFEFLFKYSPVVFSRGQWALRQDMAIGWLVGLGLVLLVLTVWVYRRQVSPISARLRWTLAALKFLVLLLLLGILLEPFISVTTVVPKKSSVLILIDDSQSMSIPDEPNGMRRMERVQKWLGSNDREGLLQQLRKNFLIRTYRFSEQPRVLNRVEDLRASGRRTDLAAALRFAEKQVEVEPVSAVILVTDGAQATRSSGETLDPLQVSAALQKARVPVYPIGVGSEIQQDLQLARVSVKKSVVDDDIVEMSALITARRASGQKVTLQLMELDRVVQSQDVVLDRKYNKISLSFRPTRKGFLKYTAMVSQLPGEIIVSNNRKSFLVKNEERSAKVLYIEELHPSEFKFIKRALDLDKSIQLVSMVRTGPDKFYRQGISHPQELAAGFPSTARELYEFNGLIIGSIEASFFSKKQIELIKAFVSRRGGGLLMLGGPKSFTEGGWDRSGVAELLPVELLPSQSSESSDAQMRYSPFKLQLTPEGLRSPLLQLSLDPVENRRLWESMPDLRSYNPLGRARPGATVLAVHPLHQPDRPKIILAEQRYGRGRSMVLATSTTWRWQMRLPSKDMRHEKFWRQIARWLALSAPAPVEITLDKDDFLPGEPVVAHISVLDSSFAPVKNAQISVEVTQPLSETGTDGAAADGDPPRSRIRTLEVVPDLKHPGNYKATFASNKEGLYQIEVLANDDRGRYLGRASTAFLVENENIEFARPDLRAGLLQRMADMTGGKYFHIDDAEQLADQLEVTESSYSKIVERDIWDAPGVYLFMVLLLAVEWYTRRSKGLS